MPIKMVDILHRKYRTCTDGKNGTQHIVRDAGARAGVLLSDSLNSAMQQVMNILGIEGGLAYGTLRFSDCYFKSDAFAGKMRLFGPVVTGKLYQPHFSKHLNIL